jgi:glycosyltransferase involved in cell wall biosynthesis
MRIAHFVQRYPPALGGSEAYFARLSRFLAAAGDRVTVFTTVAHDLEAFWSTRGRCLQPGITVEQGVEVRRYPLWRGPGKRHALRALSLLPWPAWQRWALSCNPIAWRLWRDSGRDDRPFDLVHATAFPYGWIVACALRLAQRLRVPFVVTPFLHLGNLDDPHDRTRRAYLSRGLVSLLHAADRIFVQTGVERDALLRIDLPSEKIITQGMGVDLPGCTGGNRLRARAAWGASADDVVVGHLANNSREKGTIDLLRAAERAWGRGARFRLVLAGPEMPNFRAFWRTCRVADRVPRLGVLDDEQKRDFFAGLDVFAMPSRSDSFGLVFLEAWANGAASVAYRAGGVPGVIRDGQDGLLLRCGDLDGLAEALRRLAEEPALRARLGEAGRRRLSVEFRWEDKLALVQDVYRGLVQREEFTAATAESAEKTERKSK